jgi:hypothetical protein
MESEHTPGPWFPVSPDGSKWSVVTRKGDAGFFVAQVMRHCPGDPAGEANARLIAAAPAMLDLLRKIARCAEADPVRYVAWVDSLVIDFLVELDAGT